MKKIILLMVLFICFSCNLPKTEWIEVKTTKTIKAKDSPIENKFSAGDFVFGNGSVTKSQSVYYLYFTDGDSKQVNREEYFKYDIGDNYIVISGYYKNIE